MKGYRLYLVFLAIALAGVILAEASAPKPIDWSPSFSRHHKIPYGTYVLYELLSEVFPGARIEPVEESLYLVLDDATYDSARNYIFVNSTFEPDEYDFEALSEWVAAGNSAFIAAERFGALVEDSLGFETELDFGLGRDSIETGFINPALDDEGSYTILQSYGTRYFETFDTARTTVLGTDRLGQINLIRLDHGDGAFYLSSLPYAFTNYNALRGGNGAYIFKALSYLPVQPIWWDEYYKAGREITRSPLRYIFLHDSLRWAYYLAIVGVLLFVVVHGRRRQRVIPVIAPPRNTTLDFTETVGRLYYQHGDHRNIAAKKIAYLREYIRSHLQLKGTQLDDELAARVAERSGMSHEDVVALFHRIRSIEEREKIREEDLALLNGELEAFYTNSKR